LKADLDPETTVLSLITTSRAPIGSAASYLRTHDRDDVIALRLLIQAAETENPAQENLAGYSAFKALTPADRKRLVRSIMIFDASLKFLKSANKLTMKSFMLSIPWAIPAPRSLSFQPPTSNLEPLPFFQSLTHCLRFATLLKPLSYQRLPNCPISNSFVFMFLRTARGVGGPRRWGVKVLLLLRLQLAGLGRLTLANGRKVRQRRYAGSPLSSGSTFSFPLAFLAIK
jgi:hypothetical protein